MGDNRPPSFEVAECKLWFIYAQGMMWEDSVCVRVCVRTGGAPRGGPRIWSEVSSTLVKKLDFSFETLRAKMKTKDTHLTPNVGCVRGLCLSSCPLPNPAQRIAETDRRMNENSPSHCGSRRNDPQTRGTDHHNQQDCLTVRADVPISLS